MLNYMVEVNLGLLFFYGLYWLVLRNEKQFGFRRVYLVGSLTASLLFPIIQIPSEGNQLIPSLSNTAAVYWLPELTIYANAGEVSSLPSQITIWHWIAYAYLVGLALFFILFLARIISLIALFRSSQKYFWKNYLVAESEKGHGSFSFFHFIFLGKASELTEREKEDVLVHEEAHARQFHSLDIVLSNIVGIVFWFNPVMILYRNSLVQIHEFEADARSVKGRDVNAYCSLLAKVALQSNGYPLANHFTNSLTLKRIHMMKTVRNKIKQWKVATAAMAVVFIFFVVACQDQIINELSNSTISQVSEIPANVKKDIVKLEEKYPGAKFTYVEGSADEVRKVFMKQPDQKHMIMESYEFPERQMMGVLTTDISKYDLKDVSGVFTIVEESASPMGGYPVFYEYIAKNIKYPQEARSKSVEGKVFIEFVVNVDGTLSDFVALKGIGSGCDEEAIRVLQSSTISWTPGKQQQIAVKQRMVIPITFKLGRESPAAIIIGETQDNYPGSQYEFKVTLNKTVVDGHAQISGQVKNQDGVPLRGANIIVKSTTTGTVSNSDGTFKLDTRQNTGSLVFSFIGFKTAEVEF